MQKAVQRYMCVTTAVTVKYVQLTNTYCYFTIKAMVGKVKKRADLA